jgi:PAS domain-containing protein
MKDKNHNLDEKKHESREQEITEKLNVYHEEIYFQNKELLRAQEELGKSRNAYQELFNNSPAGYVIYSNENVLIKSNVAFNAMVQKKEKDILESAITDYINEKDQDVFYFHKKKLLKENKTDSIYLRINGVKVVVVSNVIEINDEPHIKTVLIQCPKES